LPRARERAHNANTQGMEHDAPFGLCVCGSSCVLRAAVLNYLNGFLAGAIALIASLVLAGVKSCAVHV